MHDPPQLGCGRVRSKITKEQGNPDLPACGFAADKRGITAWKSRLSVSLARRAFDRNEPNDPFPAADNPIQLG
jgi:hypothetical protein